MEYCINYSLIRNGDVWTAALLELEQSAYGGGRLYQWLACVEQSH